MKEEKVHPLVRLRMHYRQDPASTAGTQRGLAKKTGVHYSTINMLERGKASMSGNLAMKFSRTTGVPAAWFFDPHSASRQIPFLTTQREDPNIQRIKYEAAIKSSAQRIQKLSKGPSAETPSPKRPGVYLLTSSPLAERMVRWVLDDLERALQEDLAQDGWFFLAVTELLCRRQERNKSPGL